VAFVTTGERAFSFRVGIQLADGRPERRQRRLLAGVIPDARRDDTRRDPRHLREAADGLSHEVNDELCQGDVELPVGEGQLFRRGATHVDTGMPLASCSDELLRRIDRRDTRCAKTLHEHRRQCARPAADVEHAMAGTNTRKVRKLRREERRVPPHEAVIGVGSDGKGHESAPFKARADRAGHAAMLVALIIIILLLALFGGIFISKFLFLLLLLLLVLLLFRGRF
jgi:hypothetical protein